MLEIGLVIVGLIIIVTSYVVSERTESELNEKKYEEVARVKSIWTEKDEKRVRDRIDSIVEERVGLAIDQTEDELSRISNEKIITSNEFSEQVLEKIEQNHEEVVFLYNMLNEKEKQMKDLIKEIDSLKAGAEKTIEEHVEKESEELLSNRGITPVVTTNSSKKVESLEKDLKEVKVDTTKENSQLSGIITVMEEEEQEETSVETAANRNKEILSLYKEGKSILEISKALDMGQGEVKLVIDLFQGVKA